MSGHVEGSKAFSRYRDIDDEIKEDSLKRIEELQNSVNSIIISVHYFVVIKICSIFVV